MMDSPDSLPIPRKSKSVGMRIFNFLSSLGLATVLLLLLGILTWLATLEQIHNGLYPTLQKYFHPHAWYVLPDVLLHIDWVPKIHGNPLTIPLPGGYWVCVLLLVNLTLGGLLRVRKGWRQAGVLIAHFGIILMIASGGVTQLFSEEGNMVVGEEGSGMPQESDAVQSYREYVVEVAEVKEDKQADIHVIRGKDLVDLEGENTRIFRLGGMPFDLEITGYLANAAPVSIRQRAPDGQTVTDGYYLAEQPDRMNGQPLAEEMKTAACHARLLYRDGKKGEPFILAGAAFQPLTLKLDERVFTIDMRKRLWPMPFRVRLEKFTADFHPGTSQPKEFISQISRIENGHEAKVTIQMNEPMRYQGLTFFQASYGPEGARPGDKLYSVFAVVENPADQWPKYSLFVVGIGLAVQFIMKLVLFLAGSSRKKSDV